IFLAALDHPAAERQAFLATACGARADLRSEVESLLAAHDDNTSQEPSPTASPTEPFAPGDLFAHRYRMVTRLGHGGVGAVGPADVLVVGVPVALKLMHSPTAAGRLHLLNEVRLARRITHPAICRVFDIGEQGDQVFMSMELVPGEDLATLIHRVGRLPS